MTGYCDGCDRLSQRLWRKGARWLCPRCLGYEL